MNTFNCSKPIAPKPTNVVNCPTNPSVYQFSAVDGYMNAIPVTTPQMLSQAPIPMNTIGTLPTTTTSVPQQQQQIYYSNNNLNPNINSREGNYNFHYTFKCLIFNLTIFYIVSFYIPNREDSKEERERKEAQESQKREDKEAE